jgi:hypothetical protein
MKKNNSDKLEAEAASPRTSTGSVPRLTGKRRGFWRPDPARSRSVWLAASLRVRGGKLKPKA